MASIQVLDQNTINKIAAGEVIERPASVVKELLENAIDAKATAVTVEIRDGGISFIRVTDNGCGISADEIPLAFLRHSTSKIRTVEDLFLVSSLGFRGEALSSIAAVAQVEVITRMQGSLTGTRYQIEGGVEKDTEEIGAPEGTTMIVRNLFYNTPVRKKFLRTAMTEGAHVGDLVEKIALSHPEISIRFIQNNQNKLYTSGNHSLKDIIYTVFGREITSNLLPIQITHEEISIEGFLGKPLIARNNRNFEHYFINGRYIKSNIICKAIEEAYKPFMMQHKYPFTMLQLRIEPELLDVNVHPTKMELRFQNGETIFHVIREGIKGILMEKELIPQISLEEKKQEKADRGKRLLIPEPFEKKRMGQMKQSGMQCRKNQIQYGDDPDRKKEWVGEEATAYNAEDGQNEIKGDLFGTMTEKAGRENPAREAKAESTVGEKSQKDVFKRNPVEENSLIRQSIESEVEREGFSVSSSIAAEKEGVLLGGNMQVTGFVDNFTNAASSPAGQIPENRVIVDNSNQDKTGSFAEKAEHCQIVDNLSRTEEKDSDENPVFSSIVDNLNTDLADSADKIQPKQMDLFEERLLAPESRSRHRLIGQLFDTYWLVEFQDQLYIMDQHAAHEKVLYEETMAALADRKTTSQMVDPPIILTLSGREEVLFERFRKAFTQIGFEIEHFGGREYAVRAVPDNLFCVAQKDLLMEMIDNLSEDMACGGLELICERVASMSCKAAVKGNHAMSISEADRLIDRLLTLENPYACPHGRPTIISMSKYELEKKFKRIV